MALKNLLFSLAFLLNCNLFLAQTGAISGKLVDSATDETIPGVKVTIDGLTGKGAMTDLDGIFVIQSVPVGTYSLSFVYNGYNSKIITDVEVKEKDTNSMLVGLDKIVREIGQITVKVTVNKESNENLIRMQRNSAQVVDGITAESIKRSTDSKASDVLKRVSGASVQDNKFVVVRGLSDRYNFALINGASLPSSESDRKAFSFDIFPSNMLDNLVIIKTATPEMPGEFAGGVIDINTTEPKEKNFHSIQLSGAFNTLTTFKDFATYDGGKLDFLGMGSSSRSIPNGSPATEDFSSISKDEKGELAKLMNFSWGRKYVAALPNGSLQYSLGKNIELKDEKRLGFVFAYNYQNNLNTNSLIRREFEEQALGVVTKMELNDSVFIRSVMNSAMLNIQLKLNNKNKISFKNLYSINSDDRVNVRKGVRELDNDPHQWERSTNIWYTQNNLLTSQIIGKHDLKKGTINWNTGFSDISRNVPNLRRVVYRKYSLLEDDSTQQYTAVIQSNGTLPTAAGNMLWSNSNEKIYSAKYDYTLAFGDDKDSNKVEFKIGGMSQYRSRDFQARNFGFSQYKPNGSSFNSFVLLQNENEIFSQQNLGLLENGQGGFKLEEASNVDDSYQAGSILHAGFLQFDAKLTKKFRFIGGARIESYNQKFNYIEFGSNLPQAIDTTVVDLLPSVNLVYAVNKKMNVRLSYYKTLSRPEFRELAPFDFYNFITDNILSGNPKLQRATIENYDIRYELYPGQSQVFSISGFYKSFTNPIELINRTGTSGAPELYYTNIPSVKNYGCEFEYRLKLGFVSKNKEHIFWNNTSVYTNMSLIRSRVDLADVAGSGGDRPLQGQSPFIVNAGLFYNHPTKSWSVSANYNIVGQRIYIVGNVQEPSVWENGRNVIDLQFAKTFGERLELKLNVKDLLAQPLVYFQDLNGNQKFDNEKNKSITTSSNPNSDNNYLTGPDNVWQEVTFGQTISLSLKYNFGIKKN